MSTKIYVGNLSWNTNDGSLRDMFSKYGSVIESTVMRDRNTGRCRGFGYVTYSSTDEANAAVNDLNQQELDGRRIKVDFASNHPEDGSKIAVEVPPGKNYEVANNVIPSSRVNNSPVDPSSSLSRSLSPLFVMAAFGLAILAIGAWLLQ